MLWLLVPVHDPRRHRHEFLQYAWTQALTNPVEEKQSLDCCINSVLETRSVTICHIPFFASYSLTAS